MAGGRAVGRFEVAIGLIGVLALTTTIAITTGWNPGTEIMAWLDRVTSVSTPAPAWNQRLGGRPGFAGITNGAQVIVTTNGSVEARYVNNGGLIWRHDAEWAAAANDIALIGRRGRGYNVIDPATGAVIWEEKNAGAVWTYSDILLDLTCPDNRGCTLRARSHRANGHVLWTVELPGNGRSITGPNPDLLDSRDPADWVASAAAASPGPAPSVIALPLDGKVQVVDLIEGQLVRQMDPAALSRVTVVASRLMVFSSIRDNGTCRFATEALDFQTQTSVWRTEGYDLDTADDIGCEQRRDPLGNDGLLSAVRGDNHPVLLDAADGSERWVGQLGERVLGTDTSLAVILGADKKSVRLIDLFDGARIAWAQRLGDNPEAVVTRYSVLIRDKANKRLIALSRSGVLLRDLKTEATVIGYGRAGIVLANGRTIGLVRVQSSA